MKKLKAFTMIEILIVVAVIGLLIGVVIPNITAIKRRSADEKKVAELGVIETALGQYRQACGAYPYDSGNLINVSANNGIPGVNGGLCPGGITLQSFLPSGFNPVWADLRYTSIARGSAVSNSRCTSYYLGVVLSSAEAVPIKRVAARGWTWAESKNTFSWQKCGPGTLADYPATVYDAVSPTPY